MAILDVPLVEQRTMAAERVLRQSHYGEIGESTIPNLDKGS